mmetsp:Transcript_44943/g.65697  ORF Transcript_44943/g.65697 Transcript_44943/m.65697 type:complete len:576 (+) Transcript_44943:32-1759(+)
MASFGTVEEIEAAITVKGDEIRAEKQAGKSNDDVAALVAELKELKVQYKNVTGKEHGKVDKGKPKGGQDERKKKKAERLAKRAQQQGGGDAQASSEADENYGDYPLINSSGLTGRVFLRIHQIDKSRADQEVWVRARVHTSRGVGKGCFLLLRQTLYTVQCTMFQGEGVSKGMVKYATALPRESIIDIRGKVVVAPSPIDSATQKDVELQILEIRCVSRVIAELPFQIEDASRPEGKAEEEGMATVGQDLRLDYRWIDTRTLANQAIFRIQSGVCALFREFLASRGFVEIHSPKLLGGASEGGSDVFELSYFNQPSCLAQSPQLYKQMTAACGDFDRVMEVGPVFRAENSNTNRHLCEFTGLDLEMAITEHYYEVLEVFSELFIFIFDGLNERYSAELAAVNEQHPFEPLQYSRPSLRLTFAEGIKLLQDAGVADVDPLGDLSTENEKRLGAIVKEMYGTDFFIMDKYPLAVRPFYTMPCPDNAELSNSYDMFIRGQEIVSGAQRIHDVDLLVERANFWQIPLQSIHSYLDAFRHGAQPHGGGGIGLERVVMLFLGLTNIRKTSLFPRDPRRLFP